MLISQAPMATSNLIRAIIAAERIDKYWEWSMISVVIELDGSNITQAYGYTYGEEIRAVELAALKIRMETLSYLKTHFEGGEALPLKILVQFDRATGKYEITFEDTDESRWRPAPQNAYSSMEELRPRLG